MALRMRLRTVALGAACAIAAWAIHRYRRRRSEDAGEVEGKDRCEPSTTDTDTSPRASDDALSLSDLQPTALAGIATDPELPEQPSQGIAAVTAAVALLTVCAAAASWALLLLAAVALCAALLPGASWHQRPTALGETSKPQRTTTVRDESQPQAKGATYHAARALLKLSLSSDFTVNTKNDDGVEWAFKIEADSVVLAWERELPEVDLLKVLVAELEWDLRVGTPLEPLARQVHELEPEVSRANPYVSTWHVLADRPDGVKEDVVTQILCFDCLAEPQGGVCCIICPSQGAASLPPVLKGHQRPSEDSFLWTVMLTPRGRPGRSKGFHIKGVCRLRGFSKTALRIGASMPSWLVKKMMRAEAEKAASVKELLRLLESKELELEQRMKFSPRAKLYEHFRCQLKGVVMF